MVYILILEHEIKVGPFEFYLSMEFKLLNSVAVYKLLPPMSPEGRALVGPSVVLTALPLSMSLGVPSLGCMV